MTPRIEQLWRMRWRTMVFRCENPRAEKFPSYGGRGIYVDASLRQWPDFWAFIQTLPGWADVETTRYSLDRKDNDGPYRPDNLRLASRKEQRANTRPLPRHPPTVLAGDREGGWVATGRWILRPRGDRQNSEVRFYEYRCGCGNLRHYAANYIRARAVRECNACSGRRGAAVRWGKT